MIDTLISVLGSIIVMSIVGAIVGFLLVIAMANPIAWVLIVLFIIYQAFSKSKK